jgi:transposase-like protein
LEEPEATTSERTTAGAGGGAGDAPKEALSPTQVQRASRRRYSKEEKLRILRLADACSERGQIGALLRREGIYHSTLRDFQEQRAQGKLEGRPQKERQVASAYDEANKRIAQLEADVRKLQHKLAQAEIIIDVQKKLSQLLGISLPSEQTSC